VSFVDEDDFESRGSKPEDIASAARGCQAILILLLVIALLVCAAYAVYVLS
jgi:hypothetical protein